jgi:putative FmdB family regulatory protein
MPAYDYDCAACGRRFEVIHGVHAEEPTTCPLCGKGPVRKAITAAAIHYKGSGWAKKERRATVTSASTKASSDGTGPEGGSGSETASRESPSSTSGESLSSESGESPSSGRKKADGASKGSASSDSGSSASSD